MADTDLLQCVNCGGVYRPIQADGTLYFHTCPKRRVVGSEAVPTKENPEATRPIFTPLDVRNENVFVGVADTDVQLDDHRAQTTVPVTDPDVISTYYRAEDEL